jgi:lipoprotein signal peptidase
MTHYIASIPLHLWVLIFAIGIFLSCVLFYFKAMPNRHAYMVVFALVLIGAVAIGYALGW